MYNSFWNHLFEFSIKQKADRHPFFQDEDSSSGNKMQALFERPEPLDDQDSWFTHIEAKVRDWLDSCPKSAGLSNINETWFRARVSVLSKSISPFKCQSPCCLLLCFMIYLSSFESYRA